MPEIGQYLPITALWRKSAMGFRTNMQAALLSFSLLMFSAVFAGGSEYEWEGVPRVVALGDIHGSLGKLTDSLRAAGLIDERLQWKGGVDHVVLCGDLVDRGPDDRKVLNLVQALQEEARRAGGRVHVLIGTDGRVKNATVLSGPQALQAAALDNVRRRKYQPTIAGGKPVEVETDISIKF